MRWPAIAALPVLSGQRGLGEVAGTVLEIAGANAFDHDLLEVDRRGCVIFASGSPCGGGVSRAARDGGGRRHRLDRWPGPCPARLSGTRVVGDGGLGARLWCRRWPVLPAGEQVLELVLESVLGLGGLDAGALELVADEGEHEHADGDQHPAEAADEPPPVVGFGRPVPSARSTRPGRCASGPGGPDERARRACRAPEWTGAASCRWMAGAGSIGEGAARHHVADAIG